MPDTDLYLTNNDYIQSLTILNISFHILTEKEYKDVYYDQMFKADWKPIFDSMSAHYLLAKGSIYALKKDKKIIATLSAAKSPGYSVAYMGFFIVDERWRGKGIGEILWKIAVNQLNNEGYRIEFDSPTELVPYYEKLGYNIVTTMTIHVLKDNRQFRKDFPEIDARVVKISEKNINDVIQYDYSILPNECRAEFLPKWIKKQKTVALCFIEEGKIGGYGVISQYIQDGSSFGYIIAPIFADNQEIANLLIISLCNTAKSGEPIYLDTLNLYPTAKALLFSLGFDVLVEVKRLSETGKLEGENRNKNAERVFALSSHGYAPF